MENDKMKMVMMNEELFTKYADAARTKLIDKMHATCKEKGEEMNPMAELSEYLTMTMFIMEFKKLLFVKNMKKNVRNDNNDMSI